MWKAQRRRRNTEAAARALWTLRVAILAPHDLIVYRSFRSELFTWNSWLKVDPRVTLGVSDCRVK